MEIVEKDLGRYLAFSRYIDGDAPAVRRKAEELRAGAADDVALIREAFHFVRDGIAHSWDAQDQRVTATASEVLREGVGICWAKANLLAALLRASGIPAGICYQRLTLGDTPDTGYCLHALNAVYVGSLGRWIRLDARGNKPGVQAEFSLEEERLAFPVRPECGEEDDGRVFAEPAPITMKVLEGSDDALCMYLHCLPDRL